MVIKPPGNTSITGTTTTEDVFSGNNNQPSRWSNTQ